MSSVRIDSRIVCNCLSFEGVFSLGNMWHARVAHSSTRLNSTSGNVLSMSNSSNHGGWNMPPIGSANSKFFAKIYNNNLLVAPFTLGQKHHVVLIFDRATSKQQLYVDGQLAAEQSNINYSGSGSNNYIFLGEGNPGCCHNFEGVNSGDFAGNYEIFRVYNKALTAAEVTQNFNSIGSSGDGGFTNVTCGGGNDGSAFALSLIHI